MRKALIGFVGLAGALLAASAVQAQQTVRIGLIMPYSGQFADTAAQMDDAIKLYVRQHGDAVAGRKIELVRKGSGGIATDVGKRLAQEMLVRESPRGPISIDPETRDIVQTIYVRRIDKVAGGELGNLELDKVEEVEDPVKARMRK